MLTASRRGSTAHLVVHTTGVSHKAGAADQQQHEAGSVVCNRSKSCTQVKKHSKSIKCTDGINPAKVSCLHQQVMACSTSCHAQCVVKQDGHRLPAQHVNPSHGQQSFCHPATPLQCTSPTHQHRPTAVSTVHAAADCWLPAHVLRILYFPLQVPKCQPDSSKLHVELSAAASSCCTDLQGGCCCAGLTVPALDCAVLGPAAQHNNAEASKLLRYNFLLLLLLASRSCAASCCASARWYTADKRGSNSS